MPANELGHPSGQLELRQIALPGFPEAPVVASGVPLSDFDAVMAAVRGVDGPIALSLLSNLDPLLHENVYEHLRDTALSDGRAISRDPAEFDQFMDRVQLPGESAEVGNFKEDLNEAAIRTWVPIFIREALSERANGSDSKEREEIAAIDGDEDGARVGEIALFAYYHYLVGREVFGPLAVSFTKDIATLQQNGALPDKLIGLRRDFEPFGMLLNKMGVQEEPAYLRRALFGKPDALDSADRGDATSQKEHYRDLTQYMKQIGVTMDEDIALLDSGCWGTLIGEVSLLRSTLSYLSTQGHRDMLLSLQPHQRYEYVLSVLPESLRNAQEVVIDPDTEAKTHIKESEIRTHVLSAALADNEVVANLDGKALKTTALNFYSHQDEPGRFPVPTNRIGSWINTAAPNILAGFPQVAELINDTMEDIALLSKVHKGPTRFTRNGDGTVDVELRKNGYETEVAARASLKGVEDAYYVEGYRRQLGASLSPEVAVSHLVALSDRARNDSEWSGVLPINTPTWEHGKNFLANDGAWNAIASIPESTFYTVDLSSIQQAA